MKRMFLLLAIAALICINPAQAKYIEMTPSSSIADLNAGACATIILTIKNNQNNEQELNVFGAGPATAWMTLSEEKFTVSANSEKKVTLQINPPANMPSGESSLVITAGSTDATDNERWDSQTISVKVTQKDSRLRGVHQLTSLPGQPNNRIRLTMYYSPAVTNQVGFNLNDGDDCCVGDTISLSATATGDHTGDGGPNGDPDIEWVDDLNKTVADIDASLYHPKTYRTPVCMYPRTCDFYADDRLPAECKECIKFLTVICDSSCNSKASGMAVKNGEGWLVTAEGKVELSMQCKEGCIVYEKDARTVKTLEVAKPGNPWFKAEYGTTKSVPSENFIITAVKDTREPNLRVNKYTYNEVAGKTVIKAEVENTGDVIAYVDKAVYTMPNTRTLYMPASINPGEKTEMLFESDQKESELAGARLDTLCTSEKTGCLKTKKFIKSFAMGPCSTDTDCDDSNPNTDDLCNYPGTPDAYCTNMGYETLKPVESTQTYNMEVTGGYECYNTEDQYQTGAQGKFSLKFDLKTMPTTLKIAAVKLFLTADQVNKLQDISVYAVSDDWKGANCMAGGDICTQPYCAECAQSTDLSGTLQQSARVNGPGVYAFDITDYVKAKYAKGDRYATFQIRGSEDKDACGGVSQWKSYDVEFASTPYVKVLF
jgi:hypothetical protein